MNTLELHNPFFLKDLYNTIIYPWLQSSFILTNNLNDRIRIGIPEFAAVEDFEVMIKD